MRSTTVHTQCDWPDDERQKGHDQQCDYGKAHGECVSWNGKPLGNSVVSLGSCQLPAETHYSISPQDKLIVVTMEQRWPYSPETEEALKPVIYGAVEN
jgi:hypothetical protein